jgi:hypothetical protein
VRRLLVLLSSIALAIVGSQLAHAAVYRIIAPDAHQREHLLAETGHAYLRLMPLGMAIVSVIVLVALLSEARSARTGSAAALRPRLWAFAAIAPATFACQEVFERLLHDGAVPWEAPLQKTFLVGLALQVPFAFATYVLARVLLRAAHEVGRLLSDPPLVARRADTRWGSIPVTFPRTALCRIALGPRGPPSPSL